MNVLNDTLSANSSLVRFLVPEEELSTQARFFPIKSINIHASPTHNHYNHSHMHTSPYYHHDLPVYDVILPYNVTHNHTVWFPDGSNYTFNHTVLVPGHEHRLVASPGGGHHGGGYHGGGHHGGGKHGGGQHGVPHHTAGHQTAALGHHGGGGYGGGGYGGGGYGGGGYGGEGYGGGGFGGLGHGGVGHGAGIIPGIGAALSGWYQLNMGFIGIGALVVVAIIASRNFFPNWLQYKSFYGGSDGYDYEFYEVPAYESGGGGGYGGYNGYRRLSWYDEWHKYWYGKDGDDYRRDNKNYYRQRRKYKRSLQSNFRATEYRNVENIPLSKKKFVLSVKSENSSHVVSVERKHRFTVPENRTFSRNLLLNKTDPYNKNNKYNNTFSEDHGEVQTLPRRPPTGKLLEAAHCAFRLLCEITKQKKKLLSKEEWKIFSLIRFSDLQLHEFSPGLALLPEASITSDYLAATHLGAEGYQCERLLGSCPLTTDQINKATGKLNNIQFSRSTNFTVNSTE